MTHEMHLLEGIILDTYAYGESGKILKILTRDYGIKSVVATGVRETKSKMRGSLDILQVVDFEFVEGREVSRLIGIHEKEKFTNIFSIEKRRVVSNIVNFVTRTVLGETKNEKLYDSFLEGIRLVNKLDFLKRGEGEAFAPQTDVLEIIWLIKILVSLGYWEVGNLDDFTEANFEFLKNPENKKQTAAYINKSIQSTHL